jgi:hypothetical protein
MRYRTSTSGLSTRWSSRGPYQVNPVGATASLSASMPGTELRIPECRTLSPFRSPQAVFSGLRINASRRAAACSFTGLGARNGLSLARNDFRFRGLHSGVNVPGLLLRSLLGISQVRSAFRSTADLGLHPLPAASSREPVTCSLPRSVCPFSGLRSPFGSFTSLVDHSVLPDSASDVSLKRHHS